MSPYSGLSAGDGRDLDEVLFRLDGIGIRLEFRDDLVFGVVDGPKSFHDIALVADEGRAAVDALESFPDDRLGEHDGGSRAVAYHVVRPLRDFDERLGARFSILSSRMIWFAMVTPSFVTWGCGSLDL
jgi:hypothetical protein